MHAYVDPEETLSVWETKELAHRLRCCHATRTTEIYETTQGECGIYFPILPEIRLLRFGSIACAR
jgi:hypothetical protein